MRGLERLTFWPEMRAAVLVALRLGFAGETERERALPLT
jgi:hypothetical protein